MIRNPVNKILPLDQLAQWRQTIVGQQKKLVLTNGCFDLLHRGHVTYLQQARLLGDVLLVALNSDASVRLLKGNTRPINAELDRAYVLAALEAVDAVVIFTSQRVTPVIRLAHPDIYVKGGDYTLETINPEERNALQEMGSQIIFITMVKDFSTSNLIARLMPTS